MQERNGSFVSLQYEKVTDYDKLTLFGGYTPSRVYNFWRNASEADVANVQLGGVFRNFEQSLN